MALTHTVEPGDTLSAIAKRFNVPKTAISGFKSNNQNLIFPGEILTIDQGTPQTSPNAQQPAIIPQAGTIDASGTALEPTRSPVAPQPVPTPQAGTVTPDGSALQPSGGIPQAQPPVAQAPIQPVQPQPAPVAPLVTALAQPTEQPTATRQVQTPSGLTIDIDEQGNIIDTETGEIITDPRQQEAENLFGGFGISTDDVANGLRTNPFGTLSAIMQQVMQFSGLPDLRANITQITSDIEDLENERDAEIAKLQDNPFFSAGSKSERIQKIQDRFELKIKNRTNRLTLLQGAQQEARQQAQFVTSAAMQLFGLQLSDQQKQEALDVERNERLLEAAKLTGALSTENVGGFQVLRDSTGKVISTKAPESGGGGGEVLGGLGSAGVLGNAANILASKFGTKFQQGSFISTANRLSQSGDEQGLADFIFSSAIDQLSDTEARKKAVSQYKIVTKLAFLKQQLDKYKALGGNTGIFRGTREDIAAGVGQIIDPNLRALGIAMQDTLDALARDRTGAVISESEEKFYDRLLPSTRKTAELNEVVIRGLSGSMLQDLNSVLKFQLTGSGFDSIEPFLGFGDNQIVQDITPEISDELNDEDITFQAPSSIGDFFKKLFGG